MATTDSRTGFRLPWSTDRSASAEATAEPAGEPAVSTHETHDDPGAAFASEPSETSQDAGEIAARGQEDEPVTTLESDTAHDRSQVEPPARGDDAATSDRAAGKAADGSATPAEGSATPARRPTKFLADLTRAMQTAAEQARTGTLEQYRADGTTAIEQIHARSADDATELRRQADDDIATIKEWSKAEIARVREETEQRVGSRREQLEGQLERHAALIEQEIEKVRGRLAAFEREMEDFFDRLLREEDPAAFAAHAASLPEPPAFGEPDHDTLAALLREPGLGVPPAAEEPPVEAAATPNEPVPDPEAAMAAIQAAAEAAAALEAAGTGGSAEPAETTSTDVAAEATDETAADATLVPAADTTPEPEADPRLAMLGITPDFAAAEAAAAEAAAAEVEDVQEIGSDALSARLSGLVDAAPATESAPAPTASTQVVVTGLVSVASIASFKRHLGRLAGVTHVGVSSGPDGEFLFAIEHAPETSLRDLIPAIPGFAPRVVDSGDGIVHVSAQDPQD